MQMKCLFVNFNLMKKCKLVSVFTKPDVNTREVGRTLDKRRKPRREAERITFMNVIPCKSIFQTEVKF